MPRGFTIIEIGITLLIVGMLLALGLPSFVTWIANTQIRTGGEAVLNGIQLARAEAVRRNTNTEFLLTDAAAAPSGTGWSVSTVTAGGVVVETVQTRSKNEGSPNAAVVMTPVNATKLTFNGMGRIATNADLTPSITQIDIANPGGGTCEVDGGTMRCLQIRVGLGGAVRMCDPKVAAGDPRAC